MASSSFTMNQAPKRASDSLSYETATHHDLLLSAAAELDHQGSHQGTESLGKNYDSWSPRFSKWETLVMAGGQRARQQHSLEGYESISSASSEAGSAAAPMQYCLPPTSVLPAPTAKKSKSGSKFAGVSRLRGEPLLWAAHITMEGRMHDLGTFSSEEAAARRYDEEAERVERPLNFPKRREVVKVPAVERGPSKYVGVSWNRKNQKWVVQICVDGKQIYLGSFNEEDDAARKYDEHAVRHGHGRRLNFPGNYRSVGGSGQMQPVMPPPLAQTRNPSKSPPSYSSEMLAQSQSFHYNKPVHAEQAVAAQALRGQDIPSVLQAASCDEVPPQPHKIQKIGHMITQGTQTATSETVPSMFAEWATPVVPPSPPSRESYFSIGHSREDEVSVPSSDSPEAAQSQSCQTEKHADSKCMAETSAAQHSHGSFLSMDSQMGPYPFSCPTSVMV